MKLGSEKGVACTSVTNYWNLAKNLNISIRSQFTSMVIGPTLLRLLRIGIAVTLIGFIFSRIGWRPIIQSLDDANWWWFLGKLILAFFALFLGAIRWRVLLTGQGVRLPVPILFKTMVIARSINNLLPGQIGGDLFRVYRGWGMPVNKVVLGASVMVDRYTGVVGLLLLLSGAALVQGNLANGPDLRILAVLCIIGSAILLLLTTVHRPIQWVSRLAELFPITRVRIIGTGLLNSLSVYTDKKGALLGAIILSAAARLTTSLGVYLGFLALGVDISLGIVVFTVLLTQVITLVPISPNGLGVREGAYVLLFAQIGVSGSDALAVALLGRVIALIIAATGGVLYITRR